MNTASDTARTNLSGTSDAPRNRYQAIADVEDLGLDYPPVDRTTEPRFDDPTNENGPELRQQLEAHVPTYTASQRKGTENDSTTQP